MFDIKYRFHSLEDFLLSKELNINAELNDGGGAKFPLKGREIEATILFADISSFSKKTLKLSSTATLLYVNKFFSWITAEALQNRNCIIDKYIGDEIMIVFSPEFGDSEHFQEALNSMMQFSVVVF